MLKRFKQLILNLDDIIGVFSLAGIIIITSANVIGRYVFNSPIIWANEVSLGLFVWFVFIGTSSVMKRSGHISIDYFVRKLPKPLASFVQVVNYLIVYILLIFAFIILGSQLTVNSSLKVTSVLHISYVYIYIVIPISGILCLLALTINLLKELKRKRGADN